MAEVTVSLRDVLPSSSADSKQPQPPSACWRVFSVLELAEAILIDLPPQKLLSTVQMVCRQWKAVVRHSVPLQEMLFFKPISHRMLWPRKVPHDGRYPTAEPLRTVWHEEFTERTVRPIENPFLYRLFDDLRDSDKSPEASWRRMSLTQPPIEGAWIGLDENWTKLSTIFASRRVTMGDVLDVGKFYGIKGFSAWKAFRNYEQLRELKLELNSTSKPTKRVFYDGEEDELDWDWLLDPTR